MKLELISVKDNTLPRRVNEFLIYIGTIKGKSKNTIKGYKTDLIIFFRFLNIYKGTSYSEIEFKEIDISKIDDDFIKSLTLEDLYAFIAFCESYRNNSSYAKARKVATLKAFFTYLHKKIKIIEDNPAIELETPKIGKRAPVFLTFEESLKLINSVGKRNFLRDYCILILFLNCGMRLTELCNIDRRNINDDTLTVIGKGNKERTIYLNEGAKQILYSYLDYRIMQDKEIEKKHKAKCDALFLSERLNRISPRTVEYMVGEVFKRSEINKDKLSPHKLRHTAATLLYVNGVDIRSLKEILGHESISTTQIYTHVSDEKLKEAVNINPLSREIAMTKL